MMRSKQLFVVFLEDIRLRACSGETVEDPATDPSSALTRELLDIQLDMRTYQQERKQLR